MIARVITVAFCGLDVRSVEVECAVAAGLPGFTIIGLADKAVSEARERVRSALHSLSLALPPKRITISLTPADLPKEGAHFDLAIALAMLSAIEAIPGDCLQETLAIGALSLDGRLNAVTGELPAALHSAELGLSLLCPQACGAEAAWVETTRVISADTLGRLIQHLNGQAVISPAAPGLVFLQNPNKDLADIKGQERAKRALEIAAAGRHHTFLVGTPGSGKSMLAARLKALLPELNAKEALETAMIHSVSGLLEEGGISRSPPFYAPHHTASKVALVGGGRKAQPGEISLAHNGILFLDELPEFSREALETLRQPLETGEIWIARASAHIRYPCRFLLIAAANPCKCGYLYQAERACNKAPHCGAHYFQRLSEPLLDRFDLCVHAEATSFTSLQNHELGETTGDIAARVRAARRCQSLRFSAHDGIHSNADAHGKLLTQTCALATETISWLHKALDHFQLSPRGYHRMLRVARTIADLEGSDTIEKPHLSEALSFRPFPASGETAKQAG